MSIKYDTHIGIVREQLSDVGLASQESHNTGALVRSHESAASSRSTVSNGLRSLLDIYLKNGGTSIDNNHGALYNNNVHFQPFSRFSSLLNFARIFLSIKHLFSYSETGRNKLHSFSKISSNVFSLFDLKMCLHQTTTCSVFSGDSQCAGWIQTFRVGLRDRTRDKSTCRSHCCSETGHLRNLANP